MAYDGDAARYPLHAAAQDGRLADLGAELRAKQEEGSLAAGTHCAPTPTHECTPSCHACPTQSAQPLRTTLPTPCLPHPRLASWRQRWWSGTGSA